MNAIVKNIFGASWGPSLLGYVLAALVELDVILKSHGLPTTWEGWLQMVVGLLIAVFGRVTKQANVSNAPKPAAAQPVPKG